MSIQSVTEFINKLPGDQSLQEEVKSATANKEITLASQAVAELAARHGYEFTAEEAMQVHQALSAEESDELNEEQLEAVAGGGRIGAAVGSAIEDVGRVIFKAIGW